MPPWLWLWLIGDLAVLIPTEVSNERHQIALYTGHGEMARIYPVGWRTARIAVFRPLPELWRRDRETAQAILLHEVAHRRHGHQFVVGLARAAPPAAGRCPQ